MHWGVWVRLGGTEGREHVEGEDHPPSAVLHSIKGGEEEKPFQCARA